MNSDSAARLVSLPANTSNQVKSNSIIPLLAFNPLFCIFFFLFPPQKCRSSIFHSFFHSAPLRSPQSSILSSSKSDPLGGGHKIKITKKKKKPKKKNRKIITKENKEERNLFQTSKQFKPRTPLLHRFSQRKKRGKVLDNFPVNYSFLVLLVIIIPFFFCPFPF